MTEFQMPHCLLLLPDILRDLVDKMAKGIVKGNIARLATLSTIRQAHRDIEQGKTRVGRIVVRL